MDEAVRIAIAIDPRPGNHPDHVVIRDAWGGCITVSTDDLAGMAAQLSAAILARHQEAKRDVDAWLAPRPRPGTDEFGAQAAAYRTLYSSSAALQHVYDAGRTLTSWIAMGGPSAEHPGSAFVPFEWANGMSSRYGYRIGRVASPSAGVCNLIAVTHVERGRSRWTRSVDGHALYSAVAEVLVTGGCSEPPFRDLDSIWEPPKTSPTRGSDDE